MLWAQRNDTVLLTVSLTDIRNEKFSLEEGVFKFRGNAGSDGKLYTLDINFYKDVVPQVKYGSLMILFGNLITSNNDVFYSLRSLGTREQTEACTLLSRRKRRDLIGQDYSVATRR